MSSRLQIVVAAVKTQFDAVRAEMGRPAIGSAGWLVGRLALKSHKAPPYVAWVRGGGRILPPMAGGNPLCGTSDQGVVITPLCDAQQVVSVAICGTTEEDTENLWFDVLLATRRAIGATSKQLGFSWKSQEEDEAGYALGGAELVIQDFEWTFVVPAERTSFVTLQTQSSPTEMLVPSTTTVEG